MTNYAIWFFLVMQFLCLGLAFVTFIVGLVKRAKRAFNVASALCLMSLASCVCAVVLSA